MKQQTFARGTLALVALALTAGVASEARASTAANTQIVSTVRVN